MRWRRTMHILAVAGVVATACGGGEGAPSAVTVPEASSTTSTTAPATTEPATGPSAEAAVEQAFYEQWDAFIEILSDPDPANPLIDRYFTGPAREQVLDAVSEFVARGHVARLPADPKKFELTVETIDLVSARRAEVVECVVDGLTVVEAGSGETVNDAVSVLRIREVFVFEDDYWKVSTTETLKRLGHRSECDG